MVRVLFIRHGMTVSNLADARLAIRVAKGKVELSNAGKINRDESIAKGFDEGSGDTNLSDYKGGGIAEAQSFGEYWQPILQSKLNAKQVHIYVSPMQRCCQTANPFITMTNSKATIQPLIFEVPGLCAPADRVFLDDQVRKLYDVGREKEGKKLFMQHSFQRCGFSANQLSARFPWIEEFAGFPVSPNERWWKGMWELPNETKQRIEAAKAWIYELSHTLPNDDVVMLFSHGDTIWQLLSSIVGIDSLEVSHATANTSVSCVKIVPGVNNNYDIQLDFYNRTPHLVGYNEDARNKDFYTFGGLSKKKMRKGAKQIDLNGGMRATREKTKEFMAKL